MASLTASTVGNAPTPPASLFEEDDESTLNILLSPTFEDADGIDLSSRFSSLKNRLASDVQQRDGSRGTTDASNVTARPYWDDLMQTAATSRRFHVPGETGGLLQKSAKPATAAGDGWKMPASFDSKSGRDHLAAVKGLLRGSVPDDVSAVRLSMSALRSLALVSGEDDISTVGDGAAGGSDSGGLRLRSLLGTRRLLTLVVEHHHRQTLARLRVIAECLRIEQEQDGESSKSRRDACIGLLDSVDSSYESGGNRRGLFRFLLTIACANVRPPARDDLARVSDLRSDDEDKMTPNLASFQSGPSMSYSSSSESSSSWRNYAADAVAAHSLQIVREREEAMEALLVLLYDRIHNGVRRIDLLLIISAFRECGSFFTNPQNSSNTIASVRLSRLAGLICAECMSLWRVSMSPPDDGNDSTFGWINEHPMFDGWNVPAGGPQSAQTELQTLCQLLLDYGSNVIKRRKEVQQRLSRQQLALNNSMDTDSVVHDKNRDATDDAVEAPEAIALLSFGLLLRLAHLSYRQSEQWWDNAAMECVSYANDECGAFVYLHEVMTALLPPNRFVKGNGFDQECRSRETTKDCKFGWPNDVEQPMLLAGETGDGNENSDANGDAEEADDAAAVAYASIGREVLTSTVLAFHDTLLSGSVSETMEENVGMLAGLASVVYRNTPALCDRFWMDWEEYCSEAEARIQEEQRHKILIADPICYLLDAAHSLAASSLAAFRQVSVYGTRTDHTDDAFVAAGYVRLLPSLVPLLRLVSTLCSNAAAAGSVLASFLPDGFVRTALVGCAHAFADNPGAGVGGESTEYAVHILESLAVVAGLCNDDGCSLLRSSLENGEVGGVNNSADGPRLLCLIANRASLASSSRPYSIKDTLSARTAASAALNILSALLQGCGGDDAVRWPWEVSVFFRSTQPGGGGFSTFGTSITAGGDGVVAASMRVLRGLSYHANRVVFFTFNNDAKKDSLKERDALSYLDVLGHGALIGLDILSTVSVPPRSASSTLFQNEEAQNHVVYAVLGALRTILKSTKSIAALHKLPSIQKSARDVRDGIVQTLATSTVLGNIVAWYASSPISLALRNTIEKFVVHHSITAASTGSIEEEESNDTKRRKYGAWESIVKHADTTVDGGSILRRCAAYARDLADNMHKIAIDSSAEHQIVRLRLARIALDLLLQWGMNAEDIILERRGFVGYSIDDNVVKKLPPILQRETASDLRALGPCRLLLSVAVAPSASPSLQSVVGSGTDCLRWPPDGISNINLLSRYLGKANISVDVAGEGLPSFEASEAMALCFRHLGVANGFHAPLSGGSSDESDVVPDILRALGGGAQIHEVLLRSFRLLNSEEISPGKNQSNIHQLLSLTLRLLDLVAACVVSHPILARNFIMGCSIASSDNDLLYHLVLAVNKFVSLASKCRSDLVDLLTDRPDLSLQARLASGSIKLITVLWTNCRRKEDNVDKNGDIHPCDVVVREILKLSSSSVSSLDHKVQLDLVSDVTLIPQALCLALSRQTPENDEDIDKIEIAKKTTLNSHTRAVVLDITKMAIDIITIEIAMCLHRVPSPNSTGPVIGLVKSLWKGSGETECSIEEWSGIFTRDSGTLVAAKSWVNLMMSTKGRLDLFVSSPNGLSAAFPSSQHNWCDVERATEFAEEISLDAAVWDIISCDAVNVMAVSEFFLIQSWTSFAQIYSSFTTKLSFDNASIAPGGGGYTNSDAANDSLAMAQCTLTALVRNANTAMEAQSTSSFVPSQKNLSPFSPSCRTGKAAHCLSELLMHALQQFRTLHTTDASSQDGDSGSRMNNSLIDMLDDLHRASAWLFSMTQPSFPLDTDVLSYSKTDPSKSNFAQTQAYNVGTLLRQGLFTSAFLIMVMMPDDHALLSQTQQKRYNKVRMGFADLACSTIHLLSFSPLSENEAVIMKSSSSQDSLIAPTKVCYHYGFDIPDREKPNHGDVVLRRNLYDDDYDHSSVLALDLLRISISVLTSILPSTLSKMDSHSFHVHSYQSDLALLLRKSDAIPSLKQHLNVASTMAAATYGVNMHASIAVKMGSLPPVAIRIHENAVDIVQRIVGLASVVTASGSDSVDISALLMEHHFVRFLFDNLLVRAACQHWETLGNICNKGTGDMNNMAGHPNSQLRGYFPRSSEEQRVGMVSLGIFAQSRKRQLACRDDPVHGIWRAIIRTMTGLLRSCRVKSQSSNMFNTVTSETLNCQYLSLVADFLCSYDSVTLSCINACSARRDIAAAQSISQDILGFTMPKTSAQNMSSSPVIFTLNNLGEAGDILALVSEVFTGSNRKQFESTCPVLYRKLLDSSLDITQSLTSFLGAVGTARELFAALSTLNRAMEEDANASNGVSSIDRPLAPVDATYDLHPLLAEEGIPAARHEAIRNAHFASSCCITMTPEDFASSLVDLGPSTNPTQGSVQRANNSSATNNSDGKGTSSSVSLEKSFQMHVNNRFIMTVEHVAAECLFHALSVITRIHPASSSFVSFTAEEVERIDAMSLVQEGIVIALRPPGFVGSRDKFAVPSEDDSFASLNHPLQFAKVLRTDTFRRTWDVEHLVSSTARDSPVIERNVLVSRLAGMEDLTKKKCILRYEPAPKSVIDEIPKASVGASVGHLVLALRWCHQHATLPCKYTLSEGNYGLSTDIIQCVSDRASMLLGTEISLHRELGSREIVGGDKVKKINAQILELFDDDEAIPEADMYSLSAEDNPNASGSKAKRGLKLVTDTEIWSSVRKQLRVELKLAKIDQEAMRKAWEQNAGSAAATSSWGGGMRRSGRRSPFRAFGRGSSL